MTALLTNSFAFFEQFLAIVAAAFTPSAVSDTAEIVPAHISARAKRLMRSDY
jgi:hypothetical protein